MYVPDDGGSVFFTMSEERSAKLKLKRKKCVTTAPCGQEVEVRLQPALNLRQDFTGSWFDEIELTAAEQVWKQVLHSVYPDLRSVGAVPSLPDFNLKMSGEEKEITNTEVLKVGDLNFEWVPLPTALTIDNAGKVCVPEIEANQQNIEHIKKPFSDTLPQNAPQRKPTELLPKQGEIPVCSEDYKRNTKDLYTSQNGSTKNVVLLPMSHKSTTENVTKPRILLKGSSKNVKVQLIPHKSSSKNAKDLQMPHKSTTKHNQELQTSRKPNVHLWATVTSLKSNTALQDHTGTEEPETQEDPHQNDVIMVDAAKEETPESSSRGRETKESAEKPAKATSSLDNCPICLKPFPKPFSQLDLDGHLAQCLSETTVDVVW
ncbi:Fanconi anemia core complex-associated protein 20 isoform X2 [Rhinoderma darwinii]